MTDDTSFPPENNFPAGYQPAKVWEWKQGNGGRFANINRPISGPTHDKELQVGKHPLQLYSLATPERRQGDGDAGRTARRRAQGR
jgi:GST-like protein